jgi:hypothetical protein
MTVSPSTKTFFDAIPGEGDEGTKPTAEVQKVSEFNSFP